MYFKIHLKEWTRQIIKLHFQNSYSILGISSFKNNQDNSNSNDNNNESSESHILNRIVNIFINLVKLFLPQFKNEYYDKEYKILSFEISYYIIYIIKIIVSYYKFIFAENKKNIVDFFIILSLNYKVFEDFKEAVHLDWDKLQQKNTK